MDNKLKIINYLGKAFDKEFTMHELSIILKIPYASFYRTVNDMENILIINKVGKSKTLKLNLKNPVIQSYLSISSEEEKKIFLEKNPIIKVLHNDLNTKDIVVIFGSYAKSEQREKSDIDIMVVNKSGEKSLSFSSFETLYDKEINPMFFKPNEFRAMLRDKEENVGKQILRYHIVLKNPEHFWELVINAIQ